MNIINNTKSLMQTIDDIPFALSEFTIDLLGGTIRKNISSITPAPGNSIRIEFGLNDYVILELDKANISYDYAFYRHLIIITVDNFTISIGFDDKHESTRIIRKNLAKEKAINESIEKNIEALNKLAKE